MSTYEADPANLGISKRYGPLRVGGVGGELPNTGTQKELVFELTAGEVFATGITLPLPAGYLVEALYVEVETAFAASSTATLVIDGGTAETIVLSTAQGITADAISTMTNLTGTSAVDIVLTANANAIATATAVINPHARVVVQYKSV